MVKRKNAATESSRIAKVSSGIVEASDPVTGSEDVRPRSPRTTPALVATMAGTPAVRL
jgi:hypothetical protein